MPQPVPLDDPVVPTTEKSAVHTTLDLAIGLATLAGCLTTTFALAVAITRPWSMMFWSSTEFGGLVAGLGMSLTLGILAGIAVRRRPRAPSVGHVIRSAVCSLVLLAIPWFVWFQPFKALWLLMYAGVATGLAAASWWIVPAVLQLLPTRFARISELVLFNLCVLALGAEIALRAIAAFHPSPVFAVGETSNAVLARYRKHPGEVHLGFPCDERGFNDHLSRAPGTSLVACIGDSFSFGLVPHAFHYTTVAERDLKGVEIYNAGVIAAGPAEYLRILKEDILPLSPDVIVIALFVGNDIEESSRFGDRWSVLERIFDVDHLMLAVLPRRLAALAREQDAHSEQGDSRPIGAIQGEGVHVEGAAAGEDPAALLERMPWLGDPSREQPTMSEATFLEVERRRAAFVCGSDEDAAFARCLSALDAIRAAAGPIRIAFLLIPDEFQVDDALWSRVAPARAERDRPQRLLRAWLEERKLPVLDLLAAFRASPETTDGSAHLYHRQDTHWNRRGNEAAGHALARFLRDWLGR